VSHSDCTYEDRCYACAKIGVETDLATARGEKTGAWVFTIVVTAMAAFGVL
jgi:hypothetical protein